MKTYAAESERLLVTASEAAKMLAISVRHVRRLQAIGILAPVRLGGAVRFRLEDVKRLAGA